MPDFDPDREKIVIDIIKEEDEPKAEPPLEEVYGMLPNPLYPRRTFRRPEDEEEEDENIYVRYYDGGYSAADEDIDYLLNSPPPLIVGSPPPGFPPNHKPFSLTTLDYVPSFNAAMLGLSIESRKEIMPEVIFNRYGASPLWLGAYAASKGYVYEGAGNIGTQGGAAFRKFDTGDTAHFKVTTDAAPGGAEVPFTVTRDCKVMLTPVIFRYTGRGYQTETIAAITPGQTFLLSGYYKQIDRSFALENAPFEALFGLPMYRKSVRETVGTASPAPLAPVAIRDFFYNWLTTDGGASLYKVKTFLSFFQSWYISHTVEPPGSMLRNGDPRIFADLGYSIDVPRFFVLDAGHNAGLLLAVILQDGVTYYVWNRFTTTSFSIGQWYNMRI